MFQPIKLVDGYALNLADGYSFTTPFVNLGNVDYFSINVTFTGGSPIGTLSLEQSNAAQSTSLQAVQPRWINDATFVNDSAPVPSGTGQNVVSVNGAGTYALNQFMVGYLWVRLKYTASVNVVTTLDVSMNIKGVGV